VKLYVPGVVGMPTMADGFALRLRPGGRLPDAMAQVNGAMPP
jgi:hypothetical protein